MNLLDRVRAMLLIAWSHKDTDATIEELREVMAGVKRHHHDETEHIKLTLEIGELAAETLKEILIPPPAPVDPFDKVFLKARVGGMTLYFKPGEDFQMSYTVKDDHQDEPFSIAPVTGAKDAEGNDIPATDFTTSPAVSDNPDAVSIVDDGSGGQALHFGGPGTAHVSVDTSYQGELVKHSEAAITVTTGTLDPNSVQGGDLVIPGLTPDA